MSINPSPTCKRIGKIVFRAANFARGKSCPHVELEELYQQGFVFLAEWPGLGGSASFEDHELGRYLIRRLGKMYRETVARGPTPQQLHVLNEPIGSLDESRAIDSADLEFGLWSRLSPPARVVLSCMLYRYPQPFGEARLGAYFGDRSLASRAAREVRDTMHKLLSGRGAS